MFTRKVQLEEDIRLIISWLWMMPLLSLPELAAVSGLPYHRCRTRICGCTTRAWSPRSPWE